MNIKKLLKFVLPLCVLLTACGGGGGGGGGVLKNAIVLLETNFGYCVGTFVSKTSVLTSADCIWGARYIKVANKNGYQYASSYYVNPYFGYRDAKNNYCTLDPNNLAVVKVNAKLFDLTHAEVAPLNVSETINPGAKVAVWGFGSKDNYLDINQVISKRVTFVSFENNFSVTDAGAAEIQYKNLYGGQALVSRNAVLGVQVCSGYYGAGQTYAFVSARHGANSKFLEAVVPDRITKLEIEKSIKDGFVKEGLPLAQEGDNNNTPYPQLLSE